MIYQTFGYHFEVRKSKIILDGLTVVILSMLYQIMLYQILYCQFSNNSICYIVSFVCQEASFSVKKA